MCDTLCLLYFQLATEQCRLYIASTLLDDYEVSTCISQKKLIKASKLQTDDQHKCSGDQLHVGELEKSRLNLGYASDPENVFYM